MERKKDELTYNYMDDVFNDEGELISSSTDSKFMTILKTILKFLSGKKSAFVGAIGLVIAYLAVKGIIGEAEVILFGGLNTIIFGGVSYATGKILYQK